MSVEANNLSFEKAEEAGSAYGELMQNFTMFDKAGNLYFAAFQTVGEVEQGRLSAAPTLREQQSTATLITIQ